MTRRVSNIWTWVYKRVRSVLLYLLLITSFYSLIIVNCSLASKTFEDKISQLQFQLANKSIKGRKALSDDEFEWLLKHIEEDEEFDMM